MLIQRGRGGGGHVRSTAPDARAGAPAESHHRFDPPGGVLNVGGIRLEGPFGETLDLLGTSAIPCALFALGASLAGYPLRGALAPAAVLTVLKLVVHPLLVWVLAVPVLGLEGLSVSVAVVLAGMPTAVNAYLFGARYDASAEVAARTVFLSSACSAVTIAVLLALLGR